MSNVYTAEEVSQHNVESDLWIVYKNGVYDITKFSKEHPGGEEVLLNLAGKDATVCFDDIGHTTEAVQLRETYKIGTMTGTFDEKPSYISPGANVEKETSAEDDNWEYTASANSEKEPPGHATTIIAAGVVIYAIIIYYFFLS
ncbi:cytochrome b5-like [Hylaeus anthracinus]|uniref:cytochrome b5-like n=1 Tax=Hylaeus anthracinus TaxID=313031 RepID=UPI0023B98354|nr:cytochrome b5-like [Hylaeus anthracinus]XP_053996677.1 cytochrome b5-like [Hylaeus anthracinus]